MTYEEILFSVDGHIATITLNRPEAMNALTHKTYAELTDALLHCASEPDVRCIVITGEGRAFCSGDDVKQIMLAPKEERPFQSQIVVKAKPTTAAETLLTINKPVIAAVNGPAVGWGMDLSLMCDIRIASERAKFGELFIRRGLVADLGGTYRLPLIVGLSKASELLFTGDVIDAQEAERIGLVTRTVPHDDLMPAVMELATKIAKNPPIAMQFMKEAIRKGLDMHLAEMGEYTGYAYSILFKTEDHLEGARSFVEKREPVFQGR
jgi:enoyl-CoA hydratase/carnithine racemase